MGYDAGEVEEAKVESAEDGAREDEPGPIGEKTTNQNHEERSTESEERCVPGKGNFEMSKDFDEDTEHEDDAGERDGECGTHETLEGDEGEIEHESENDADNRKYKREAQESGSI